MGRSSDILSGFRTEHLPLILTTRPWLFWEHRHDDYSSFVIEPQLYTENSSSIPSDPFGLDLYGYTGWASMVELATIINIFITGARVNDEEFPFRGYVAVNESMTGGLDLVTIRIDYDDVEGELRDYNYKLVIDILGIDLVSNQKYIYTVQGGEIVTLEKVNGAKVNIPSNHLAFSSDHYAWLRSVQRKLETVEEKEEEAIVNQSLPPSPRVPPKRRT